MHTSTAIPVLRVARLLRYRRKSRTIGLIISALCVLSCLMKWPSSVMFSLRVANTSLVDIANDVNDDSSPLARDALVVMAVAVDASWKVPIAYFLVSGMTAAERANLIRECLNRLHAIGAIVTSLPCDGPSCHFSMIKDLGANIYPLSSIFQPSFAHPFDPEMRVFDLLNYQNGMTLLIFWVIKDNLSI